MPLDTKYVLGQSLHGDDFTPQEIDEWFRDEENAYASLGAKNRQEYKYRYHALNTALGFRFLPDQKFDRVLGLGSAYGHEFLPVSARLGSITVVESSDAFSPVDEISDRCEYVKPTVSGRLPFADSSFDLVTCFGVLHHIPNVSFVVSELARCSRGYLLIREPIVSMGDWTLPRVGLTPRERGIPLNVFRSMIGQADLEIVRESLLGFPLVSGALSYINIAAFENSLLTKIDVLLSRAFSWNVKYHAHGVLQKIRPTSVFYVLKK